MSPQYKRGGREGGGSSAQRKSWVRLVVRPVLTQPEALSWRCEQLGEDGITILTVSSRSTFLEKVIYYK